MKGVPGSLALAELAPRVRPVWMYLFNWGEGWVGLTSHDTSFSVTGVPPVLGGIDITFAPAQVGHGQVEQGVEGNGGRITVTVGINEGALAAQLRRAALFNPPKGIQVVVARGDGAKLPFLDWTQDVYPIFRGVVESMTVEVAAVTLTCVSLLMQAEGRVPRYFYQKTCQHALYGPFCGADPTRAAVRLQTVLSAVDRVNRSVDIPDSTHNGSTMTGGWFQGGTLMLHTDSSRTTTIATLTVWASSVVSGGGHRLWLGWWIPELTVGRYVTVLRGCNRTLDDCVGIHNNGPNFGGFPFIPDTSPSIEGIR